MENPWAISAGQNFGIARENLRRWLQHFRVEQVLDTVVFEWCLFQKSTCMTICFDWARENKVFIEDGNIIVRHPRIVRIKHLSIHPDVTGYGVTDAVRNCLTMAGVDSVDAHGNDIIQPILNEIMGNWIQLLSNSTNVTVNLRYIDACTTTPKIKMWNGLKEIIIDILTNQRVD